MRGFFRFSFDLLFLFEEHSNAIGCSVQFSFGVASSVLGQQLGEVVEATHFLQTQNVGATFLQLFNDASQTTIGPLQMVGQFKSSATRKTGRNSAAKELN